MEEHKRFAAPAPTPKAGVLWIKTWHPSGMLSVVLMCCLWVQMWFKGGFLNDSDVSALLIYRPSKTIVAKTVGATCFGAGHCDIQGVQEE